MSETMMISQIIEANAPLQLEQIIVQEIKEFKNSEKYKMMGKARNYYLNTNDIVSKKRWQIIDGIKSVNEYASNNTISHPFLRDLVDQKVQYLLGNDWSVDDQSLADVFNDDFRGVLQRTARDAVLYGSGWLFLYPEESELKIQRVEADNIIPIWVDNDHTELQAVIRFFENIEYAGKEKKTVNYVEWWTLEGCKRYKQDGETLTPVETVPYMSTQEGNDYNWIRMPFVSLKYNDDEISILQLIKSMIDQYDRTVSDTSDLLQDIVDKIKVISGAEGTPVAEIANNLKLSRLMILPQGGSVAEIGSPPDVTASIAHLEQLKRNIFEFGRGVDTNSDIGANASGTARQYLYAKLDLDCNQLESGVLRCLRQVIWFLNNKPFQPMNVDENVKITFSRNMMINTAEIVDVAVKAQGIDGVTQETIVGLLPFVENPIEEIAKSKAQEEGELLKRLDIFEQLDQMPFGGVSIEEQ